jgi:hypothetical protein
MPNPRRVRLTVEFTCHDETDIDNLGERIFDFLGDDPDDLFPEVETVEDWLIVWDTKRAEGSSDAP